MSPRRTGRRSSGPEKNHSIEHLHGINGDEVKDSPDLKAREFGNGVYENSNYPPWH
jgi:hypothetical protein